MIVMLMHPSHQGRQITLPSMLRVASIRRPSAYRMDSAFIANHLPPHAKTPSMVPSAEVRIYAVSSVVLPIPLDSSLAHVTYLMFERI